MSVMNTISDRGANACIYTTLAVVLLLGLCTAWYTRKEHQFLSGNGTRKAIPLMLNFVAPVVSAATLAGYPPVGALAGLHGVLVNAIASAIPFLFFGFLGPLLKNHCPQGFVLTEWIRQRYGACASLLVSACTMLTLFLFMVAELSSVKQAVESMSNVPGLPVIIVECLVVSVYASLGGFATSFVTDNIQCIAFFVLFVVCIVTVGCTFRLDSSLVGPSRLLDANLLGWKLVYILPVSIITNDFFVAGYWIRTFAAKTPRDLLIASSLATLLIFLILSVVGIPGMLAVWGRELNPSSPSFYNDSNSSLYYVIRACPAWLSGLSLVLILVVSPCAFDSLQTALVSTISNDLFRNRVRVIWVRVLVYLIMIPCIIVALRAINVLNIWLIVDVLSACIVPVLFLGLWDCFYFLTGFEIILGFLGGIFSLFGFGCVYYHSVSAGGALVIMTNGIYGDDWGAFGAFVAAPVGCIAGALVGLVLRAIYLAVYTSRIFAVFDRPPAGQTHWPPADLDWFRYNSEWYSNCKFPKLAQSVDYWLFVQNVDYGGDEVEFLKHLTHTCGLDVFVDEGRKEKNLVSSKVVGEPNDQECT